MEENERISTGCHLCWHNCKVSLTIKDGVLVNASGGAGAPCDRIAHAPEFHYHPKRLNHPIRRIGARGSGAWERISWDEALDRIAAKMARVREEDGPEAIAKVGGTIHGPGDWAAWKFFCHWGSPNIYNMGKNCGQASVLVECAMVGSDSYGAHAVAGVTRTIVLWGANPPESDPANWETIRHCQAKGARLVVIDPRFSEAASYADLWIQPHPGTDGALGWGVVHTLIKEGLYDREFVENWCTGFDLVSEKAAAYTLQRCQAATGVPAWQIQALARLFADGPTHLAWGLSGCHHGAGAGYATVYTQALIRAITGNVDRYGGNLLTGPSPLGVAWDRDIGWDELLSHLEAGERDSLSADRFPVCSKASMRRINDAVRRAWGVGYGLPLYFLWPSSRSIWDAIRYSKPYPIRVLFIQSGNPLLTLAGARECHDALGQVDLLVGMDFFMTPSMAMCDYVLPATSWLEQPNLMMYWGVSSTVSAYERPLPPIGNRKDDYVLWKELAKRLNVGGTWPESLEKAYDLLLESCGTTFRELAHSATQTIGTDTGARFERYRTIGFGTPSGKCELAPSSLAAAGLDPVPDYCEPPQSAARTPQLIRDFPLTLVSGARLRPYWHTSYREIRKLRWRHELPELFVHPETARNENVLDGDTVSVETPLGSVRLRARVTTVVKPGVVYAEAFWSYPEQPAEEPFLQGIWDSNINAIISDDYEYQDFAGDLPFRGMLCRIRKADRPLDFSVPVFQ